VEQGGFRDIMTRDERREILIDLILERNRFLTLNTSKDYYDLKRAQLRRNSVSWLTSVVNCMLIHILRSRKNDETR